MNGEINQAMLDAIQIFKIKLQILYDQCLIFNNQSNFIFPLCWQL
jgi:hypothetical protein